MKTSTKTTTSTAVKAVKSPATTPTVAKVIPAGKSIEQVRKAVYDGLLADVVAMINVLSASAGLHKRVLTPQGSADYLCKISACGGNHIPLLIIHDELVGLLPAVSYKPFEVSPVVGKHGTLIARTNRSPHGLAWTRVYAQLGKDIVNNDGMIEVYTPADHAPAKPKAKAKSIADFPKELPPPKPKTVLKLMYR